MLLNTSCTFKFYISDFTPFIFMLRVQSNSNQFIISEEFTVKPNLEITQFQDIYGNFYQRLIAPPGKFKLKSNTKVILKDNYNDAFAKEFIEVHKLPQEVLLYLLPSRFCESDRFNQMACEITQGLALGYEQVLAITTWIQNNIVYESSSSDIHVSAIEVNNRKYGVCRDFAHLAIALCRSISIPSRIVVGYLYELEPMDLHAWFEVYIGNDWYRFDATQVEEKNGYVVVAYGRDAADVAVYNQYGATLFPSSQKIKVKKLKE
ncbi:MAG: transglutaminase family protein [Aliarcobacter sp.]|nr:transglutaminase family protein [Aliarcobacter sp.]